MRSKLLILGLLAASVLPCAAFAGDSGSDKKKSDDFNCTITADKDDKVAQHKDLVIHPGEKVKDAVVLHGNVTLKKGAVVEKVVAINGNVILEAGSKVKDDVVALAGSVFVHEDVEIGGDLTALSGTLNVDAKATVKGDRMSLGKVEINGTDYARKMIHEAIANERHCKVEKK